LRAVDPLRGATAAVHLSSCYVWSRAVSEVELRAEVDYDARVRAAIAAMRRATMDAVDAFEADFLEGKKNRFADDAGPDHSLGFAMRQYADVRLLDLVDRDIPLFFGRLWLDSGEDYHIGRRHVRDESDRSIPLVVDWRAPVAERFYRASPHHRQEVSRRRRFGFQASTLTSFEDEDLHLEQHYTSDLLADEIERPRTGPMRDIVATIQPEQDELIRRDASTTLCVQGAPGTGKTAVGLHRAAWLLYTYPGSLGKEGMLVVGPNDGFLRYISGVLPTLGETSVWQATVDQLTEALAVRGTDRPEVALLKHHERMGQVCERAVWSHVGTATEDLVIPHAGVRWALPAGHLIEVINRARASSRTWDAGRKAVEQALIQGIRRQVEQRTLRTVDTRWINAFKRQPGYKSFLDAVWPQLTAKHVLRKLYTDDAFRASVCDGLLSADEQELLGYGNGPLKPSAADVLLLDEIQAHLKARPSMRTYGHVIVDEAQDLSPMQCRAIARRCPSGSLTVLGDLAQGTTPWAAADWPRQMAHFGREDAEHTDLADGFRVPQVIIELANRLLPHLGVSVSPARSLRSDGSIDVLASADLASATVDAVEKALVNEGVIGVIAPDDTYEAITRALPARDRVEVIPAGLAKGLEFDHVVVVEPADIITAGSTGGAARDSVGLRHLYVALTRAVSRLTIVHAQPLPAELVEVSPRA
jgi:DNA helicase IV